MNFLVIGQNYYPEPTSVSPFTTGVCEHLVKLGHKVTVIAPFPHYPEWKVYKKYRRKVYFNERINGVNVHRVIHFIPSKPRKFINRLLYDVSFPLAALLVIPFIGKYDGIFCSSPSPFVPWTAWIASRLRRVKFIIKLTDLSTDVAKSLNIIKNSWIINLARIIENYPYKKASAVSVLCNGFKENLIKQGVDNKKIYFVPVWADTEKIRPLQKANIFQQRYNFKPNGFATLHAGNMGMKQGLEVLIDTAKLSEGDNNITWLIVGDGERKEYLINLAKQYKLRNIRFLPLQPEKMVPYMLSFADVLLLVQKKTITDSVIPSKLLTYMASGRPIIAAAHQDSESAYQIRRAKCGIIVPPEKPEAILSAVNEMRKSPLKMAELGNNGRIYVERKFSKDIVLRSYEKLFSQIFPSFKS